jgi:hypothetical protein
MITVKRRCEVGTVKRATYDRETRAKEIEKFQKNLLTNSKKYDIIKEN